MGGVAFGAILAFGEILAFGAIFAANLGNANFFAMALAGGGPASHPTPPQARRCDGSAGAKIAAREERGTMRCSSLRVVKREQQQRARGACQADANEITSMAINTVRRAGVASMTQLIEATHLNGVEGDSGTCSSSRGTGALQDCAEEMIRDRALPSGAKEEQYARLLQHCNSD